MLNRQDDFPIHQTPDPVAIPTTGDRNVYDRYFFNGYTRDGALYFAAAMGFYANRSVLDASFSVVRGGVQTSVHGSRRAPLERTETAVGPIAVEVLDAMRSLKLSVAENEAGVRAELTFAARTVAVEEPRFTRRTGTRVRMDSTRFTQWGSWQGFVQVGGERIEVDSSRVLGARDRSWGIRPVGEPEGGAPGAPGQFFWLWAPIHFDDLCAHFDVIEDGEGRVENSNGSIIPILADPADEVIDYGETIAAKMESVSHRVRWRPGTRRAESAEIVLASFRGDERVIALEPMLTFQMLGLGYLHPEWGHGIWKGEEVVGCEQWKPAELNPLDPRHIHVQELCRARMGEREGIGILEQLVIGPHQPSGFEGLLDGAK
jgi:hypothetical protein